MATIENREDTTYDDGTMTGEVIPEAQRYRPLEKRGLEFTTNDGMLIEVWPSDEHAGEIQMAFSYWPKRSFWEDGKEKIEPTPGRAILHLPPEQARWVIEQIERCLHADD